MAANGEILCCVCEERHESTIAVEYCNVCLGLCEKCLVVHKYLKGCESPSHNTISIDKYKQLPTVISAIKQTCDEHEQTFVLYCCVHEEPCCPQCTDTKHVTCNRFLSLDGVVRNAALSTKLSDMDQELDLLCENIDIVCCNRENAWLKFQESITVAKTEIKCIREKINIMMDKMETDAMVRIKDIEEKFRKEIDGTISNLRGHIDRVIQIKNDVAIIKNNATDYQIFAALRMLRSSIDREENLFAELFEDDNLLCQKDLEVQCSHNKSVSSITTIIEEMFHVRPVEQSCRVSLSGNDCSQAQLLLPKSNKVDDISLQTAQTLSVKNQVTDRWLSDCLFLSDNTLVLADYSSNKELIVCNEKGNILKTHSLNDGPYCIAKCKAGLIAVTVPELRKSFLLNLDTEEQTGSISFETRCWGICTSGDKRFIREYSGGIHCVNLNGAIEKSISVEGYITHMCFSAGKLYYTQHNPNLVTCCSEDGTKLWQVATDSSPYGIVVDKHSIAFVVSGNKVIAISPDGAVTRELLDERNGLYDPYAVDYDFKRNKLMLVKDRRGVIDIYDVVYGNC